MSKLDTLIDDPSYKGEYGTTPAQLKQNIKDLMLEVIGADEVFTDLPLVDHTGKVTSVVNGKSYTPYMVAKNLLRADLRAKVNEL